MSRLPDLVLDSCLKTEFSKGYTVHTYRTFDTTADRQSKTEKVYWSKKRTIGAGSYGTVYVQKRRTTQDNGSSDLRAIKRISNASHRSFVHELEAIAKFSNPRYEHCFVKSFGWYEHKSSLYIAMEYLSLGDLYQCISRLAPVSELDVQAITAQILEGVQFMHDNNYAHRDIKPQNILVKSMPPDPWWLKIADFGISERNDTESATITTILGSPGFLAPEMLISSTCARGLPSQDLFAADIWAVGCVTYYLFVGKTPFQDDPRMMSNYFHGDAPCPALDLSERNVTSDCLSLLSSLLDADAGSRPRAREARKHQWLQEFWNEDDPMVLVSVDGRETDSALRDDSSSTDLHSIASSVTGSAIDRVIHTEASGRWTTEVQPSPSIDRCMEQVLAIRIVDQTFEYPGGDNVALTVEVPESDGERLAAPAHRSTTLRPHAPIYTRRTQRVAQQRPSPLPTAHTSYTGPKRTKNKGPAKRYSDLKRIQRRSIRYGLWWLKFPPWIKDVPDKIVQNESFLKPAATFPCIARDIGSLRAEGYAQYQ